MIFNKVGAFLVGLMLVFAVLAKGAHDPWAATIVYLTSLGLLSSVLLNAYRQKESQGLRLFSPLTLAAVILALGISFTRSVQPWESFYEWCDWLAALALFVTAIRIFEDEAAPRILIFFAVPLLWIELILSLAQIGGRPALFPFQRCPGSLINANVAAGFFLFWIPVLTSAVQDEGGKKSFRWIFTLSGLLACGINLLLTLSVSAWILALMYIHFAVGSSPLEQKNTPSSSKMKSIYIGLILLAVLLVAVKWGEVFGWAGQGPKPGITSRIIWWQSGLEMFKDHPFVGVGIGNYSSAYLAYKVGEGIHTFFPHSWPIGMLAETGILGFGALAAFFVVWAATVFKNRNIIQGRKSFAVGMGLSLPYSLINVNFEILANLLVLFVFAGVVVAPIVKDRVPLRLSTVLVLLALAASALPFIVSPFLASQRVVEGERLLLENRPDQAGKYFAAAFSLDPRSWQAQNGWSRTAEARFAQTKEARFLQAALHHKQQAIRLNKLSGALYWELGLLQIEAGAKKEGIRMLEQGVHLWPSNQELKAKLEEIKKTSTL